GSSAQIKVTKQVGGKLKGELAQFRELAAFAQFGSDLDAKTKAQLERGARIVELFKQPQLNPLAIEMQASILWALQKNYFDSIEVKNVVAAANSLKDYLTTRKADLLNSIRNEAKLSDQIEAGLKSAADEWKATFAK
ncbi:MAG: F0F1 ATP synthase subunit alpha, partial [Opitutus sp.]